MRSARRLSHVANSRLAQRATSLKRDAGSAAPLWEFINGLAARPGNLNCGQGMPDYEGSIVARAAAADAVRLGSAAHNQYSPQPGLLELRQEVAAFVNRRYGEVLEPRSQVAVTSGGQEALAAAFLSFLDPGDEVVVFEPHYPFMMGAIANSGAVPRPVTLREGDGFALDEEALREACRSPRAKMLVLNSPHNPTGHVVTQSELSLVSRLAREHDLLCISDEVYEHALFPTRGLQHMRLSDQPGMRERTITLGSGGKLFSLTGWRVAWAYGPEELIQPLSLAHTHLSFSAPTPLQVGVAAALRCEDGLDAVGALYERNFNALESALTDGCGDMIDSVVPAAGGYFLVAKSRGGLADADVLRRIAEEKGVVCAPMTPFYSTPFKAEEPCTLVRFAICKSEALIARVCENLRR